METTLGPSTSSDKLGKITGFEYFSVEQLHKTCYHSYIYISFISKSYTEHKMEVLLLLFFFYFILALPLTFSVTIMPPKRSMHLITQRFKNILPLLTTLDKCVLS